MNVRRGDPSKALVCAVHDEPLVDCPCKPTPGLTPAVFKVKPAWERSEEFRVYLSVPRD
jgi:hypothetical protein